MRPRIGITSGLGGPVWAEDGSSWLPYAEAVRRAGGEAVHLSAWTRGREGETLDGLQGILFTGGKDIHVSLYPSPPELDGEGPEAYMQRFHMRPEPDRDAYEIPLLQEAVQRDLPLLGICRGCQVLNVALGGQLVLDIPMETGTPVPHSSHPPPDGASGKHAVRVLEGSLLSAALEPAQDEECNSRHHQAVRGEGAPSVRVVAVSPEDGLVEAIEVRGRRWAVGVQWHPEHPGDPEVRIRYEPLFRAFILAAS